MMLMFEVFLDPSPYDVVPGYLLLLHCYSLSDDELGCLSV